MAERRWTITGWHPGSPGTGGVYVQGPGLEPGEQVTVVEVPGPMSDREAELWERGYRAERVWRGEHER